MFFALSKILAFLLSPVNWILAAALVAVFARDRRRKKRAVTAAFVLFLVFTNGFLANKAMQLLEIGSVGREELDRSYPVGIVLGGMIRYTSDSTQVNFNANGDRLFQAIDLYASGKIDRILISSGSGLIQRPAFREASLIKGYLVGIGLPPGDILVETRSRNTRENAVETRALLDSLYPDAVRQQYLLITSASHMRRAAACFRKIGLDVVPYSTTKRTVEGRPVYAPEMILPDPAALYAWKGINHEWIGWIVYKVKGYV